MRATTLSVTTLALGLIVCSVHEARAETATAEDTARVCGNWLSYIVHQKGGWAGEAEPRIAGVQDIVGSDGDTVLAHCFSIAPRGYVVVPVLKELPPVKAYSEEYGLDADQSEGMAALIRDVLEHRINLFKKKYGSLDATKPRSGDVLFGRVHRQQWDRFLIDPDQLNARLNRDSFVPLPAVGPLLTTVWDRALPTTTPAPLATATRR